MEGITLKPYVVVLSVKPAVRLPQNIGKLEFNFTDPTGPKKLIVTKIEEESAGALVQTGISFRVFIDSETIQDAIYSARGFVDGIVSLITMLTGKGMEVPREEIAYELTTDVSRREFLQMFYDVPLRSASRRQVDPQQLSDFITKLFEIKPPFSEHIIRAIRWYRLGATVADPFDQFNCFWIGLEALNPLLQEKFSVKDDQACCPKCGHKWIATPTVSGIRAFMQNKLPQEKDLYRKIRELRIDVMHSTKKLRELSEAVATYSPKTGEILFRGICFLVEFINWESLAYRAILKEFPTRGELRAILIGGNPSSLGPKGQDPHFELSHNIRRIELQEKTMTSTIDTTFKAQLNVGVQFDQLELLLYGDAETSGTIISKEFKKGENSLEVPARQEPSSVPELNFEVVDIMPVFEDWSTYKFPDGTIFKIRHVLIKALRKHDFDLEGNPLYEFQSKTVLGAVPPKVNWGVPSPPYSQQELEASIVQKDVRFQTIQEPLNNYLLSDGTKLQVKTTLVAASKTNKYGFNGEPEYLVSWNSITNTEIPDNLKRH